ncbi:unnamed protein product, partial [Staurois parvus]
RNKLAFRCRFYQRFKRKLANRIHKRLRLQFFFTLPVPNAVQSLFFIMKNACKVFSRYPNEQNTEHRMFLPSLSHIVMTHSHLRHLPPLETKGYVNDHSHLKFLM